MRNGYSSGAALAVLAWSLGIPAAWAAPAENGTGADAGAEDASPEIVVTAQKRNQNVNDVPIAINAFGGAALADAGVKSLESLSAIAPSLTVTSTAATGVPVYTIRGVGFSDYSTSASSTVGIYADDIALPYAVMTRGAFFDVGQVEVLKGPQGDLYGRNSTAGQININSARPTDTFKAGASADVSNWGETNLEAYVSGPLTDTLKGRLAGKVVQGGAWQQSITRPGDKLGNQNVMAVRGSLDWQATPTLSLFLSGHYIQDKSDNQAPTAYDGQLIGQATYRLGSPVTNSIYGDPAAVFSTGNNRAADWNSGQYKPRRNNKLAGLVFKGDLDLGFATLTSLTGYDNFRRRESNDWDGWAGNESNNINDTKIDVVSEEVHLSSKEGGPLTWIVGGYYSHDTMNETYNYFMQQSVYVTTIGAQTLSTRYRQTTSSAAAFAHAEYALGGGWDVIGGIRYTHERRFWRGCTYDSGDGTLGAFVGVPAGGCATFDDIPGTPDFGTPAVYENTIRANRVMWKVGLDKKFGPNLVYATVSSSFKSGGFSGINTTLQSQLSPYGPEKVIAYEVGAKLALLHKTLRINGAAFWYDYRDKQETNYVNTFAGALAQMTNVPRARVRGFELDATWQATRNLSFQASTTYLDARVTRWPDAGIDAGGVAVSTDVSGARLANAPSWQSNLAGTYEHRVGSGLTAFLTVDMNARTSYSGRILELDPSSAVPGYTLVNGRLGIKAADDKWRVSLWMRNMADRYYYTSAFVGNSLFVRMNGMPRTVGLSGQVSF